jgi:hypothetical protein
MCPIFRFASEDIRSTFSGKTDHEKKAVEREREREREREKNNKIKNTIVVISECCLCFYPLLRSGNKCSVVQVMLMGEVGLRVHIDW